MPHDHVAVDVMADRGHMSYSHAMGEAACTAAVQYCKQVAASHAAGEGEGEPTIVSTSFAATAQSNPNPNPNPGPGPDPDPNPNPNFNLSTWVTLM